MQEYITAKTKSGIDIVGVLLEDSGNHVIVENPLEITVDPHEGMYAKSFLLLSEQNSVLLKKEDLFYVQFANVKAIEYYEEFRSKIRGNISDSNSSDLEEIFETLLEAKSSIKH